MLLGMEAFYVVVLTGVVLGVGVLALVGLHRLGLLERRG
jgi:hypothetical protein